MASSKETYCLCGQPYNIGQFMIECDCCREWFHGSCVDVKIYHSDDIDKYHCPKCAQTYGPSQLKIPTNNHRADRYEHGAETRPSQVGTPAWVRALAARPLRPLPAALQRMRPHQFTEEFIRDEGFTRPVVFHTPDGLDMKVPNAATFTVRSVLRYCGTQLEVEVIDVRKQSMLRMTLGDFVDYFETLPEHRDEKVLNVLSLEFSDTNLSPLVEPPAVVRSLDWVARAWPATEERPPRPSVQKYCLMSAEGAYTDFHVDFGGTTVWYHVMHGRKIFYLIPPTSTNLALYQQWSASNNQNERFFGDMVEWYGTAEVCAGQTLVIPPGWVHAVLTPCDALVFGGNFLHSYAVEMQLQIYEIERRVETPLMFRYPLFETMHWHAGAHLLAVLRRHNEDTQDEDFTLCGAGGAAPLPALLLRGVRILATALKEWHALKSSDAAKRDNVPKCVNSGQLVRELARELRALDKRAAQARDKEIKVKQNSSPNKHKRQQSSQKKSLKLTLPKPIMHMGQNGEFAEEKVYSDKFFIDNKEVVYDTRFVNQDTKFINGLPDKYLVEGKDMGLPDKFTYQGYDEMTYQDGNGFVERDDKKTILKIKMNNSPSSSRDDAPPPYNLPEHSILKSHLIRDRPTLKPLHQWTISKKDAGEYHEEQILFTNENLVRVDAQDMGYGPGMYSAEDVQPEYQQFTPAKPPPHYSYDEQYASYTYQPDVHVTQQQQASYSTVPLPEPLAFPASTQLPSYDAAIAQQYATNNFAPAPAAGAAPVRRSERASRRRLSNSYSYSDELEPEPAPRRPRHKHRHVPTGGSAAYRPARQPANGIESLIQASELAEEKSQPAEADATEDVAVAGMLSISSQFSSPHRAFGLASDAPAPAPAPAPADSSSSKRSRKAAPAGPPADDPYDEEDVIKEVHRDDEYVYPSLEMSSDEDEDWSSSRRRRTSRNRTESKSKSDKDAAWCPRARVGRVCPRARSAGPRAASRRECVRAALTAAASAKRQPVIPAKSKRPPPVPVQTTPNNKNSRLKKGMKTAKQRLGKILKIHKMMY